MYTCISCIFILVGDDWGFPLYLVFSLSSPLYSTSSWLLSHRMRTILCTRRPKTPYIMKEGGLFEDIEMKLIFRADCLFSIYTSSSRSPKNYPRLFVGLLANPYLRPGATEVHLTDP